MKCLNLALNDSAPEGEWHAAAIRFCAILRRGRFTVGDLWGADESTRPRPKQRPKKSPPHAAMPFGKFKGQLFRDLPDWYVDWCLGQDFVTDTLLESLKNESARRKNSPA
jgi:hypothetical protein